MLMVSLKMALGESSPVLSSTRLPDEVQGGPKMYLLAGLSINCIAVKPVDEIGVFSVATLYSVEKPR